MLAFTFVVVKTEFFVVDTILSLNVAVIRGVKSFILCVSEEVKVIFELFHQVSHLLWGDLVNMLMETFARRSRGVELISAGGYNLLDSLFNHCRIDSWGAKQEFEDFSQDWLGLFN